MGIRIPEKNVVISGECIQCMQCLSICPKESLSASPALEDMEKAGTAALEGEDVGEGRTEGGNFNRAVIQIYGIKSMFISFRLPS